MYCILGLCFLCKRVCVLEAGVGMSSGEEEKRLLGRYMEGSQPWIPTAKGMSIGVKAVQGRGHMFQQGPSD